MDVLGNGQCDATCGRLARMYVYILCVSFILYLIDIHVHKWFQIFQISDF